MLAFFASLFTALVASFFLQNIGAFGSCFEGSCGYVTLLAAPIITLLLWPLFKRWKQRWAIGTRIMIWTLAAAVPASILSGYLALVVLMWGCIIFFIKYKLLREKKLPLHHLFFEPATVSKEPIL